MQLPVYDGVVALIQNERDVNGTLTKSVAETPVSIAPRS